jgi:HK97 family phage portal protein
MNWFNNHKKKIDKTLDRQEGKLQHFLSYQSLGEPLWTSPVFHQLIQEGYENNVIAYRCCMLIAHNIGGLSLKVMKDGLTVEDHPVLKILRNPNPLQNGNAFLEAVSAYLLLAGNSYLALSCPQNESYIQELYTLRPDHIHVKFNSDGFPTSYIYALEDRKQESPIDPLTGWSRILKISLFNPLESTSSNHISSPMVAARRHIDLYNAIISHNLALLQNGGCPSGAFVVENSLTQSQRQQLKESIQSTCQGEKNGGRILVLEGGIQWKEMGFSPHQLNFADGINAASRAIAQAFGVPPMLIGLTGDATFSNYKEARMHLWEDTILPMADMIFNHLSRWLGPLFKDTFEITYDLDKITALSPKRDSAWERIQSADYLTVNEKRKAMGYGPLDSTGQNSNYLEF